ncbi:MAG: FGGY family carbohydrate kinase [bacterium]|nr:FGGY family carbohydrate kinase [Candidatus Sumerlaeota bacterium]
MTMMTELLLGIDLGTSYFKVGLFDNTGKLRGLGRVAVEAEYPRPGWCELPVTRFHDLLRGALGRALKEAEASPRQIRGVSYSSQANSFLLLDCHGAPLTPFILWPDTRAAIIDPQIHDLLARHDFLEHAGFKMETPELAIAKLRWLQCHRSDIWSKMDSVMSISDYLAWLLTGERVGDQSTASLLGIWQPEKAAWWREGLDAAGIDSSRLSALLPPGMAAGHTGAAAGELFGLSLRTPVAAGALDHVAAAYGAGIGALSPCCDSTGTVLAVVCLADSYDPSPDYCVGPAPGERYYKLAFHSNGARLLEWHQKRRVPERGVGELIAESFMAGIAPPLPFVDLIEDDKRSIGFRDVLPHHSIAHHTRALVELLTSNLAELVARVAPGRNFPCILATGGGAHNPDWLQLKADILGTPFVTVTNPEPACFGAALFASTAAGWHKTVTEASRAMVKTAAHYYPKGPRTT